MRRWQRFVSNQRSRVRSLYVPLVLGAIENWHTQRLYLALDTTMLWNRFCIIHLSIVCGGRAVPFLSKVLEHKSSTVAFAEFERRQKAEGAKAFFWPHAGRRLSCRGIQTHSPLLTAKSKILSEQARRTWFGKGNTCGQALCRLAGVTGPKSVKEEVKSNLLREAIASDCLPWQALG